MLCQTTFQNSRNVDVRFVYDIQDKRCVFSAIDPASTGSSVNNAERIIIAISLAERLNPREFEWFDLQTAVSYPSYELGEYSYNRLEFTSEDALRFGGISWNSKPLPPDVLAAFSAIIGPNPRVKQY